MGKNDDFVQGSLFPELDGVVGATHPKKTKSSSRKKKSSVAELNGVILSLQKANDEQQIEIERLKKECAALKSKAEAFDDLVQSNSLFTVNIIAKSFGRSAIWLNKYLHEKKVQYQQGEVWVLYAKYASKGYTRICWYNYSEDSQGRPLQKAHTYWTGKGLVFIRELLKADGLLKN